MWKNSFLLSLCGLAPLASVLLGLSPFPTIQHILHESKVENFPLLPYTTMVISSSLWFGYGVLKGDASLWACNGITLVMGCYYMLSYIRFAHTASAKTLPGTVQDHIQAVIVTTMAIALWAMLPCVKDPSWLIGSVAMVSGVCLFASPLASLQVVIETKSSQSIPLPFVIASCVCCSLWLAYGLWQTEDRNIYIPNILGLIIALSQLVLKGCYEDSLLDELIEEADHLFETTDKDGIAEERQPLNISEHSAFVSTTYKAMTLE